MSEEQTFGFNFCPLEVAILTFNCRVYDLGVRLDLKRRGE